MTKRSAKARLAISILLLAPCYWHRNIEAGDLGSHTYNAWLAQLIRTGRAPGLWLARQYDNVLFDWMLEAATRLFGFGVGERLCASIAGLIFFWGGFTLVEAVAGRNVWRATPLLAMVSYGWTFQMGLFNYYLGLGLAFFGLAACWRNSRAGAAICALLFPVVWLAHPLSAAILAGLTAYIIVARLLPIKFHPLLLLACFAVIAAARLYLAAHLHVMWDNSDPFFLNGTDQFVLFGPRYAVVADAVLVLLVSAFILDFAVNPRALISRALPMELYLLALLTALWLPDYIPLPEYAAPFTLVTVRLTSVCGVLACAWLASVQPRTWQVVGLSFVAVLYFGMMYQDTGVLSRAEDTVVRLVASAPGQRVILVVQPASHRASRVGDGHLVDRACVGRCFSFSNYEPASKQFRVRATNGNGIVTARAADSAAMQNGVYVVQAGDLPVLSIYQCGPAVTDICSRRLAAREENGKLAY